PEAPHERAGVRRVSVGPQASVVAIGQVVVDRHGFEEDELAVDERRNALVRIDRTVGGRAGRAVVEVDRDVLVREADLLERPDAAPRTRGRDAVEGDARPGFRRRRRAPAGTRTLHGAGFDFGTGRVLAWIVSTPIRIAAKSFETKSA